MAGRTLAALARSYSEEAITIQNRVNHGSRAINEYVLS
jgi:hypothetical protein